MRRIASSLLAAILLAGSASVVVAAGEPTRAPVPFPPGGIVLPGGVFCAFDLFAEATKNTEVATTFPAAEDGTVLQIVTGQLWVRLTNLANGANVVVNISGPSKVVIDPDGTSHYMQFGRQVAVAPGGFIIYSGKVIQTIYPDGSAIILSTLGNQTDICALLSAA